MKAIAVEEPPIVASVLTGLRAYVLVDHVEVTPNRTVTIRLRVRPVTGTGQELPFTHLTIKLPTFQAMKLQDELNEALGVVGRLDQQPYEAKMEVFP